MPSHCLPRGSGRGIVAAQTYDGKGAGREFRYSFLSGWLNVWVRASVRHRTLEVHDKVEFCGLLGGKIGGFLAAFGLSALLLLICTLGAINIGFHTIETDL